MHTKLSSSRIPADHISYEAQSAIQKLLEPLQKSLGIHYFNYTETYPDASGFTLHTDATFYESWFENEFPMCQFFLKNAWYTWESCSHPEMISIANSLGVGHGMLHIEHQENKTVCIAYACPQENKQAINVLLNNLQILKRFKHYFAEKAETFIIKAQNQRINYLPKMIEKSNLNESTQQESKMLLGTELFSPFNSLSSRELECFRMLLKGFTLKDISSQLAISSTTVDGYIARVKQKLNCTTKQELIALANDYGLIEYCMI